MHRINRRIWLSALLFIALFASVTAAQSSAFTYQGRLTDTGTQPTDTYAMEFRLFGSSGDNDQIGNPVTFDGVGPNPAPVPVANGVFTVQLDFGATAFNGNPRWLQIAVKKPTDSSFVTLNPRQAITSTPYALRTFAATSADALSGACTLCVTDAHIQAINGTKVTGTVANATNASTAGNVSGVVAIANGGTGSSTQNFVDLLTSQTVGGNKTFSGSINGSGSGLTNLNGNNLTDGSVSTSKLADGSVTESKLAADLLNSQNRQATLLAMKRWDQLKRQIDFPIGTPQFGIVFDGTSLWVSNGAVSGNVLKIRPSDGAVLATYPTGGSHPHGLVFDGTNIWVANNGSNNVTKIRVSDGSNLGVTVVGTAPEELAFDGANVWVTNSGSGDVTKLRASDGVVQGTFAVGTLPQGIVFDGNFIWVANSSQNTLSYLTSTGFSGSVTVCSNPYDLAFDGSNIWVTCPVVGEIRKVRGDGTPLGTFSVPSPIYQVSAVAFDGVDIWVTGMTTHGRLRASDGVFLNVYPFAGDTARAIAFDGTNMWLANNGSSSITRLSPVFRQ